MDKKKTSPPPVNQNGNKDKDKKKKVTKRSRTLAIRQTDMIMVKGGVDRPMLVIIILLLCFGTVMVFSASFAYALETEGDSYFYIKKQLQFAGMGLIVMFIATIVDYRVIRRFTIPVFVVVFGLLAIVPIIGISSGSATRWISIPGVISFQPSELMKIAMILFLALYFDTFQERITNYKDFRQSSIWGIFLPTGVVGLICVLIMLENHFSGMIIMFAIGMIVIFVGGGRKVWFGITGFSASFAILCAIVFVPYAKKRLDMWINPENYSTRNDTWQTTQGLIAVGSGGFLGVGLGNSRQKHMFVPEPQNDFIFSIVCEELGFVGALAVIALFILFIWRGFVIAMKAPDTFSSLVVIGIVVKVGLQAILNMAVVTNLIPNTGISLPFFSYGGSALTILLGEMGILLSISKFSYQKK
jgi:Bacterial cell division membrane protein